MAKQERVIDHIEFKTPSMVIDLRNGLRITPENLTVERYNKLISLAPTFKKFFTIKYKPKKNELETKK